MPARPRIYIDACYYIDVAKGQEVVKKEQPGREADVRYVETALVAAQSGDIEIIASTLLIAECLHVGSSDQIPQAAKDKFRGILTSGQGVTLVAPDVFIAERARDLLWVYGIECGGGADAVHVATALEGQCEEFWTTNTGKGPANPKAVPALHKLNLSVIAATQTQVLPGKYTKPLFGLGSP